MKMLSYLIDVYHHQLKDLTGVNYGWILRRFIAFFLVGLLIGIVATHAFSDIRSDFKTGSIEIWFDETGERKKVYNYADAVVTRRIEGNEHISELTWDDGYCLKFSHYHKITEKRNGQIPPPPTPEPVQTTVGDTGNSSASTVSHTVETNIISPEAPERETPSAPASTRHPLQVVEYMVRDWNNYVGNLPQWIELYNPNTGPVNLKDDTFQYATRRFANHPYKIHTLTLGDHIIPAGGTALLVTHAVPTRQVSGIDPKQVYNLRIPNILKHGWLLMDADGQEIHRIGREAFGALADPVAPLHRERARVSHHVYPSEAPSEPYYYGKREDIGSPGFYQEAVPTAPSVVRRKRVGTWASLKGERNRDNISQ